MKYFLVLVLLLSLISCGGGGGGGGSAAPAFIAPEAESSDLEFTNGQFKPASTFAALCENPRMGINPETGISYADANGSTTAENFWLRSWSNDFYLWYDEIIDEDPNLFSSTLNYFDVLKTNAITNSGNPKDNFHFTVPTPEWVALSQSGVSVSYGATFSLISNTPPRKILVAYVEPGSEADNNGITRGAEIIAINGVDAINDSTDDGIDTLNEGLLPTVSGQTHNFTLIDAGASTSRNVNLEAGVAVSNPVLVTNTISTATGDVGYILFNDHLATAEAQLVTAINAMLLSGPVSDLILDLRYNGGGFLAIASQLAYMIAGETNTAGKAFERELFNDKHTVSNPITGEILQPLAFLSQTVGLSASVSAGTPLMSLDLSRVFIIAGEDTCSASEAIINGLRGVGVEVILIGEATCGKPYGFYPQDNCGITYFSIQFAGENDIGFSDYSDGFRPNNSLSSIGIPVTGCAVADDYSRELGDTSEARLAAALSYRATATCPAPSATSSKSSGAQKPSKQGATNNSDITVKPLWLQNRIMDGMR